MEERINQVITKRNPDDKHISIYALCIALLAITSFINFLLITFVPLEASIKQILTEFDYGVALIFLVDFLFRLLRAPKKLEYMRTWGWLDMLSAVPIPFFSIFRIVRVIRVAIMLRKMRLKDVERSITKHPARSTIIATGFLAFLVMVSGSAIMLAVEKGDPSANIRTGGDALWWAIVTMATVGYGDKYPVTGGGRITATIVMAVGIVIFGVLSSYLASTFISSNEAQAKEAMIAALKEDLDTIKADAAASREHLNLMEAEMAEIKQLLQQRNQAS
ncbi:MAG: ion transporter [Chloroflexi bacterium]|nr:MAG: ion transporter [Chloroflexota bacterium]